MISAAIVLVVAVPDVAQPTAVPSAAANFSEADSYLDYLLASDVLMSGEFRMAFNALGMERTCALLRPAYGKARNELKPAWRRLFAKMLSSGIESPGPLVANAEISQGQREVLLGMGLAGNELVSRKSETIKNRLADEALKVPDDAIDYPAREKEMGAAVAKDLADCGLLKTSDQR